MMMEKDLRNRGRSALRSILETASYTVEDLDDPLAVSAVGQDDCVLAMISDDPSEIEHFDATNYRMQDGDKTLPCKKLVFSLADGASVTNSVLWGREEFMRYAGAAVLAGVLGQRLGIRLEASHVQRAEGSAAAEAGAGPSSTPVDENGPEVMHLPLKVDPARAVRIAGIDGSAKLRFMPYWRYHLVSDGERTFKDKLISFKADKWGAVNAINGIEMDVAFDKAASSAIPGDAELVQPKNQKDGVEAKIVSDLIDKLTQRLRVRTDKGDAIFYEEKIFKPEKKDVKIDLDLVYVPIWQVRGKKIVEVNGFTGEILSMPMDEGCEVL